MYKILIADDEGIVINFLKFIIEKEYGENCEIRSAKTGKEVIELAESYRPDIAFMDIQMPGINGIEAMREIRRFNSRIIFIVMTAYDQFDYAQKSIEIGVLEYLNKPAEPEKILAVLAKACSMVDAERSRLSRDLRVKEKLENMLPVIENGFVSSLLFQDYNRETVDNYRGMLDTDCTHAYVAVIEAEIPDDTHVINAAVEAGIKLQSIYSEVRPMIKSVFGGYPGAPMAARIPVLVEVDSDRLSYSMRNEVVENAGRLISSIFKKFGIRVRIGIGRVARLDQVQGSYNEAVSVIAGTLSAVAHVDDFILEDNSGEEDISDLENELYGMIKKGSCDGSREAAARMFEKLGEVYRDYPEKMRTRILELMVLAASQAGQAGAVRNIESRAQSLQELMALHSTAGMRAWFTGAAEQLASLVLSKTMDKSMGVVDRARQYMELNYKSDISLQEVSRELDISSYYFSKLFKEETGRNFVEYLTAIRMEKAKELIRSSELTMKEICVEVGYPDANYFSRNFKKHTGMTPTEYKENSSLG